MSWNEYWQQFETPFRNCAQGSSAYPVKEKRWRVIRLYSKFIQAGEQEQAMRRAAEGN